MPTPNTMNRHQEIYATHSETSEIIINYEKLRDSPPPIVCILDHLVSISNIGSQQEGASHAIRHIVVSKDLYIQNVNSVDYVNLKSELD